MNDFIKRILYKKYYSDMKYRDCHGVDNRMLKKILLHIENEPFYLRSSNYKRRYWAKFISNIKKNNMFLKMNKKVMDDYFCNHVEVLKNLGYIKIIQPNIKNRPLNYFPERMTVFGYRYLKCVDVSGRALSLIKNIFLYTALFLCAVMVMAVVFFAVGWVLNGKF